MRYIPGALGGSFRGKLGGVVGSRNYSVDFLRRLNVPHDPTSYLQTTKRWTFYNLTKKWKTVKASHGTQWATLASQIPFTNSLSQTYYLDAFQMFCFCNLNLLQNSYAFISAPGDISHNNFPDLAGSSVSIITTPGSEDITLHLPAVPTAPQAVIVMATCSVSAGISKPTNFKWIYTANHTFTNGGTIMIPYEAIYGAMPKTSDTVWFQLYYIDTTYGFKGLKTKFYAIAVA